MKILIIFIYFLSTVYSYAIEKPNIDNIVFLEKPKIYKDVIFKDIYENNLNISDYEGKLLILNFWATWCAPCKEEMPSLDLLQKNENLENLKIFPINVGPDNIENASKFFKDLEINNLELYFDNSITLAKKFEALSIFS